MDLLKDINKLNLTQKQIELFQSLKINTLNDILNNFPSSYLNYTETELKDGKVVIEAKIISNIKIAYFQGKKNRIYFDVTHQDKLIKVSIFNRAFLFNNFKKIEIISIIGVYNEALNSLVASDIKLKPLNQIQKIQPNYSLTNKYKNSDYVKLIYKLFNEIDIVENLIPDFLIKKYKLLNRKESLKKIHFPQSMNDVEIAQRTLIYEEFFLYAIKSLIEIKNKVQDNSLKKIIDINKVDLLINSLPYQLSKSQKNALNDIYKDFISPSLMNRILLADVGSGKTIVALISSYMIYLSKFQSSFMAPTTILAQQHYEEAIKIFKNTNMKIELLTSQTSISERKEILSRLKSNEIDLLIGTHALYQNDVVFNNLGFVIIDEQQRFGVLQRNSLKEKGTNVEVLMLSATPIPRTLAQVIFASIQVSYMKESLSFKKSIISYYFQSKSIKPFYDKMIEILEANQQIYVVTPLVEESEHIDTKNVIDVHKNIKNYFKNKYRVGIIHGQMNNDVKQQVMSDFQNHYIDILVTTSLIEVGISVDNATCIIIYDAHRFGLSQLHQLRGRVGRDEKQGYAVFLSDSKDENTIKKLDFIASHNDGFEISEYDLQMRGPGDILGIKQSGIPSFNVANPINDHNIFEIAYQDVIDLIEDKEKFDIYYENIKHYINKSYEN